MALTRTRLLLVPAVGLTEGAYVAAPSPPVALPSGDAFIAYELTLVVADADKLATGKSLTFHVERSDDQGTSWHFVEGTVWESYGPSGLTVTDPDGTVWVNRDPTIGIPSGDASPDAQYRAQIEGSGIASVDLAVNGLTPE